ncbi:MAG TPA: hypothetical protein VFB71_08185, partial [Ramlibacter sp.]|nr:hypothetical protein [Ramlibacter sp.]
MLALALPSGALPLFALFCLREAALHSGEELTDSLSLYAAAGGRPGLTRVKDAECADAYGSRNATETPDEAHPGTAGPAGAGGPG